MPSVPRSVRALLDRRLPVKTRVGLFSLGARRRLVPREVYRVRLGGGSVYLTDADFGVDLASFDFAVREGSYATDYTDAVVLDLGAHKGYFGAYASVRGAREVIAYEPERANLALLERTAATYGARGVRWTTYGAAVDAATAPQSFTSWVDRGATRSRLRSRSPVRGRSRARGRRRTRRRPRGSGVACGRARVVVKMNIEGAECSAILHTDAAAWEGIDEVFVETHPWADCGAEELTARLGLAGLRAAPNALATIVRMQRERRPRSDRRSRPR